MTLYDLNVTVQVLAAFLWLGGMPFLAVVVAPVLREIESPELRSKLFKGAACPPRLRTSGIFGRIPRDTAGAKPSRG